MASDRTTSSTSDEDSRGGGGAGGAGRDSAAVRRQQGEGKRPTDMVETLRLAQKSLHPWRELLNYALELHSPIYAMIASGEPGNRPVVFLIVLITSLSPYSLFSLVGVFNGSKVWVKFQYL